MIACSLVFLSCIADEEIGPTITELGICPCDSSAEIVDDGTSHDSGTVLVRPVNTHRDVPPGEQEGLLVPCWKTEGKGVLTIEWVVLTHCSAYVYILREDGAMARELVKPSRLTGSGLYSAEWSLTDETGAMVPRGEIYRIKLRYRYVDVKVSESGVVLSAVPAGEKSFEKYIKLD